LVDLEAIGSSAQGIESRARCIDLKFEATGNRQGGQSNHNPQLDKALAQGEDFQIGFLCQSKDGSVIELDFGPAVTPGVNTISRFEWKVYACGRPVDIGGSL
jgi:hypothetical protein